MRTREIEVETMDGLSKEERMEERAVLAEAGLSNGWTEDAGSGKAKGVFDDLMDGLHRTQGDASAMPHQAEIDEMNRWEKSFLAAAQKELTSRLVASGMFCGRAFVDPMRGDAYTFVFRDGEARSFSVSLTVDDALDMRIALGEDWGRSLIDKLTTEAHEARRRYFARMM